MQPTVVSENISKTAALIKCEVDDDCQQFNAHGHGGVSPAMSLGNYSIKANNFGNTTEILDCVVCGDRATGKHYGAISCDGCKGFFRRSVRKNPVYECRHQNSCIIDKDKRNQCRHCRWKKCIRMGMKKEAVQKERDRLGRQRSSNFNYGAATIKTSPKMPSELNEVDDDDLSVMALVKAEKTAQEYIGRQIRFDRQTSPEERVQANLETICISMNYQLRSLIEWAKDLKSFVELTDNDKIALLRGHTGENLVLGVACRSLACDDYLLLGNHYIIPRNTSDPGLARAASRILDEIVKPLKEIELDDKEYACLKAIVFFDNDNKSLSDPKKVKDIRKRIQVNLENYINHHRPLMPGRFGDMLLLLPPLQNIARLMVDSVARYNQDTKQVDDLINEMLLNRYFDDCQEPVTSTTTKTMSSNNYTNFSSPSNSISKENDFDSNTSSIDTDMEDNISQDGSQQFDPMTSTSGVSNSVLLVGSSVDEDLHNVSLTEHDDYLSNNLSHIHILQHAVNNDQSMMNLSTTLRDDRSDTLLEYYPDQQMKVDCSKSTNSLPVPPSNQSFDPNSDMSFLCDLITPPTTNTPIREAQAIPSSHISSSGNPHYYGSLWNN